MCLSGAPARIKVDSWCDPLVSNTELGLVPCCRLSPLGDKWGMGSTPTPQLSSGDDILPVRGDTQCQAPSSQGAHVYSACTKRGLGREGHVCASAR